MTLKILKTLSGLILIASISIYLVLNNEETVNVYFTESFQQQLPLGVALLISFVVGILIASFAAILYGIRFALKERKYKNTIRNFSELQNMLLAGRSARVGEDFSKALLLFRKAAKYSPEDPIAKIELAKTQLEQKEFSEALKTLDYIRARYPENLEVLTLSGLLNEKLNNKTAAIDNYNLVLERQFSTQASRRAMSLSDELGRYDEALEYAALLERQGFPETEKKSEILFHQIMKNDSEPARYKELKTLLKAYPQCSLVLKELAYLEEKNQNEKEAAQYLLKEAQSAKTLESWDALIAFWLRAKKPENALNIANKAIEESTKNDEKMAAKLAKLRLCLSLGMFDETNSLIEQLQNEMSLLNEETKQAFYYLRSLNAALLGDREFAIENMQKHDSIARNDVQASH